jgi:hypothetical protein
LNDGEYHLLPGEGLAEAMHFTMLSWTWVNSQPLAPTTEIIAAMGGLS